MKKYPISLVLLFISQISFGQITISKDSAMHIARLNGLQKGMEQPDARLVQDSVWEVRCLLCDEDGGDQQIIRINAHTGKLEPAVIHMSSLDIFAGGQMPKTKFHSPVDWNDVPSKDSQSIPYRLTEKDLGRESNPVFSPNSKIVAIQYGFRKIGIVKTDGHGFEKIDDESFYPQWLDNKWIAYFKDFKYIVKKNIKTGQVVQITKSPGNYNDYQISPDHRWIAYTSGEVWNQPKDSSGGKQIIHAFINGGEMELCLLSMDGKIKKYVTKTGEYVHTPCWSDTGDSLFFYIDNTQFFTTSFNDDTVRYYRRDNEQLALTDYKKIVSGILPIKRNCRIYAIDVTQMEPVQMLVSNRGRYSNPVFSNDLKYLIYSTKACKTCDDKLLIKKINDIP